MYKNYDKYEDTNNGYKQDDLIKNSKALSYYKQPSASEIKKTTALENAYASQGVQYQTLPDSYKSVYVDAKPTLNSDKGKTIYVNNNKYAYDQYLPKPLSNHQVLSYDNYKGSPVESKKSSYVDVYSTDQYYQPGIIDSRKPVFTDTSKAIQANNYNSIVVDNQKPVEYYAPPMYANVPTADYKIPEEVYIAKGQSYVVKQAPKTNDYSSISTSTKNNKYIAYEPNKPTPTVVEHQSPYYIANQNPQFLEQLLPKAEHEIQSYVHSQIPKFTEKQKQVLLEFPEYQMLKNVQKPYVQYVEKNKPVIAEYYTPTLVDKEVPYYVEKTKPVVPEKSSTSCSTANRVAEKIESKPVYEKKPRVIEHHRTTYINNDQPTVIEQTVVDAASCSNSCGQPLVWAKDVPVPTKLKDLSFLDDIDLKSKSGSSANASAKTVVNIGM